MNLQMSTNKTLLRESTVSEIKHRTVETNGIRMHIAESGAGPLVVLCHGFPETWYSWRLLEAGIEMFAAAFPGQPPSRWDLLRSTLDEGFRSIDRRLRECGPLQPERFNLK